MINFLKSVSYKIYGYVVLIIGILTFGYLKGKESQKNKQRKAKEKNDKKLKKIRKNTKRSLKSLVDELRNGKF